MKLLPEEFNNVSIAGSQTRMPSKTYRMNIEEETVSGAITDDLEAVRQAVYKILNTERYKHIIIPRITAWNLPICLANLCLTLSLKSRAG